MKIAMIAPPWIPIPPSKYGGIETVIYNLAEGLHALGHEVILFAPRGTQVSCKYYPYLESDFDFGVNSPEGEKAVVRELSLKYAYARAGYQQVDIIHDHTLFNFSINIPTIYTIYGAATEGSIKQCLEVKANPQNHFVAISERQREHYSMLNRDLSIVGVVYHGINVKDIKWTDKKDDFFLAVGRASWQKGLDITARVAAQAKIGLIMAVKRAKDEEKEFFQKEIQPWIDRHPHDLLLQVFDEVPRATLFDLMRRAKCVLFSSQWEQPFGLVMIEAAACGTPVIALRRGAAPEVIVDGKTGFLVNSEQEMIKAIKKIGKIDPRACRQHAENNFSREKMVENYLKLYQQIIE